MSSERVVVLAGCLAQFRMWCRLAGHDPQSRSVVYARDVRVLHGLRVARVVRYGTWRLREDAQALDNLARSLQA